MTFPPSVPTSLTKLIKSYLYVQYNDDDNLQSFVSAFSGLGQQYIDWTNATPLTVYTNTSISGLLLDWVGAGFYGYPRPSLPSGFNTRVGPLNTWTPNTLALNQEKIHVGQHFYTTTDDIYKRCLTWHLYRGDGNVFDIRWLKRRVLRFLIGVNGTAPDVSNTGQISVSMSSSQVNISILSGSRRVTGGALPNLFAANTVTPNQIKTVFRNLGPPYAFAQTLQAAIQSGVLELPLQYTYTVTIVL